MKKVSERANIIKKYSSPGKVAYEVEKLKKDLSDVDLDDLQSQIDFIASNTDPEALDSLTEIVEAFQEADGDLNQAITNLANGLQEQIDTLASFGYEQVVCVAKNGSDENDGSQHSPFLTVKAALASITDATPSKRYAIRVAAGVYAESGNFDLKANVYIMGEDRNLTSISATSFRMASDFSGGADNRSGMSNLTVLSPANFDWSVVTSAAGKLYFQNVQFNSTCTLTGHNSGIAQAQLWGTSHFGLFTVSGINLLTVGTRISSNALMLQHPILPTIWDANGGSLGLLTMTTTVNNFNRRCSMFAKSFFLDSVLVDGPVSYCDYTASSLGLNNSTANGGQLIPMNPSSSAGANTSLSNLAFPTAVNQPIMPANTNATNFGDWGKQWFWNFGYVHASTGTDLFLISYGESFGADSSGKSIGVYADGAGLQENVNGGNIVLQTASTSGSGVRGVVRLNGREIDVTSKKIVNVADGTAATDAINKGQLDSAIGAIPTPSQNVIEVTDIGSAPAEGEIETIYVAKDGNKIYRYDEITEELTLPEIPAAPTLTPTTSITDADDLQATINAAQDGDVIFLANGTYSYAGLSITKQVALVGESQAGVLIQDTRSNSQSFLGVSVDNVTLKDLTVRHVTTDSNIGIAIAASGAGFPQVRLNNFRMYNVKSQYSKGGLSVRSNNFVVEGCTFEVVAGSSTRRGILHYGNGGDSFIKNNLFINTTTGALRAITPTSTSGTNPSDNQSGSLTIEGSTFSGNLSQFVNMDNHQGSAGDFELIIKDNVTPETNAFVVSFGGAANFGDLFSRIVLIGNTLTNNHSSGLGKGAFAIDAFNGLLNYRSSPLPVVSLNNTLGQLVFRAGYSEASGSTGAIVGYNNTQVNLPTVELGTGASTTQSYIELNPSPKTRSGEAAIVDGATEVSVVFSSDMGTNDYSLSCSLINMADASPIFLDKIITAKSSTGFTVKFSQATDSVNYRISYQAQVYV
jgi:hypothetical protein